MTGRLGWFGLCSVLSGALCGCSNLPAPYAPPPQRPIFEPPPEAARIFNMDDADAEFHFVQDISMVLEANAWVVPGTTDAWRWSGKRPTLHLHPGTNQKLTYSIDFVIASTALEHTGPQTLSFFVNDHLLERARYATAGRRRIEKSVPAEWVDPDENVILAAEVDKVWTPEPGVRLGFILIALGLEQK